MSVKIDTKGLDSLVKAFKNNKLKVRVGIIGKKPTRAEGGSNAEIGAKHEFGNSEVPQRSWLRMPLIERLFKQLVASGAFEKAKLKAVIRTGSMRGYYKKIAFVAENVVLDAFATAGYGKWVKWGAGYTNNTGQILVDTQQLMRSTSAEVVEE